MKKLVFSLVLCLSLSGCWKEYYLGHNFRCDITRSHAVHAEDRRIDEKQCWSYKVDDGMEASNECSKRVANYLFNRYGDYHHHAEFRIRDKHYCD